MNVIFRIIGGILIVLVGVTFVIKTEWFLQNFGQIAWAEQHLGFEGGSRLFYKLLGVTICIIGMLMATGMLGGLLVGTIGRLFVPR
jgi:hypothetical protein